MFHYTVGISVLRVALVILRGTILSLIRYLIIIYFQKKIMIEHKNKIGTYLTKVDEN